MFLSQAAAALSAGRAACTGRVPASVGIVGSCSWSSHWQCKNRSLLERSVVFDLKIFLGSSWSAPAEGRPQAGGSQCPVVPLRHSDVSAYAE